MHGVDAKKFLPVNPSLYIDDIGKHFGAFRCLLKKTAICLYFHCLDTQFPGAIALEYLEGGTETPIVATSRGYIDYGTFFVQLTKLVKTIVFLHCVSVYFSSNFVHSFQRFIANLMQI